jgi:hypothetical protein
MVRAPGQLLQVLPCDRRISVSFCCSTRGKQYPSLGERNAGFLDTVIKTWHFLGKTCKKKVKELYLTSSSVSSLSLPTLPQTYYLHLCVLRYVHSFILKMKMLLGNYDLSFRQGSLPSLCGCR